MKLSNKLAKLFIIPTFLLSSCLATFTPLPVFASADTICSSSAPDEVKKAAGCSGGGDITGVVTNILNGIIAVMGFVAVIFVVVGGVQYMTSAGDTQKTEKAKKTIIYALIGMAVCVLAFAIVNYAIVNVIG